MKLIGHLNGFVAIRETLEEYLPINGVNRRDITSVVGEYFHFNQRPPLDGNPGVSDQILIFQGGSFDYNGEHVAIGMLIMEANSDIVQVNFTDHGEAFLENLSNLLKEALGFRFDDSPKEYRYVSNVVVEFEEGFSDGLGVVSKIGRIVGKSIKLWHESGLKRVAFGIPPDRNLSSQIEIIENTDFSIERRAGEPLTSNRYYCSAPMKSADHVRLLREIEAEVLKG